MRATARLIAAAGLIFGLAVVGHGQPPADGKGDLALGLFRRADTNRDGKLSKAEFVAVAGQAPRLKAMGDPAALFARLDKNGDGSLTPDEFRVLATLRPGEAKPKADAKPEAAPSADGVAFFEKHIRPVLADSCYSCHSTDGKQKGGLALDTRDATRRGGDSGAAVVPGDKGASLLLSALHGSNNQKQMPPKDKLSDATIANFEKWIAMGAPDPRAGSKPEKATAPVSDIDIAKGRQHWAFQPVKAAAGAGDLDQYVAAARDAKGLKPVPEADPRTLVRRLAFDLLGLPPAAADVEAFAAEPSPVAYAALADRYLASPAFGERWGRHWLDVARYAESSGKATNFSYPYAWRYRDYVIDAFTRDVPFDRFLTEQLAGDLLPATDDAERARLIVATGFLAVGPKEHNERNREQFQWDLIDEQIDATFLAFQGLTVACARCHDHKFDPIPQSDYYAVAGIFKCSDTLYGTTRGLQNQNAASLAELPAKCGLPAGLEPLSASRRADLERRVAGIKADLDKLTGADRFVSQQAVRSRVEMQQLESTLDMYHADGTPKLQAMGMREKRSPSDAKLLVRGEIAKPADAVHRGFPQVLAEKQPTKLTGSGRAELAAFLASPTNPLTARVYANRVWLWLMGRGVVTSPDNFGLSGDAPTHPALLDHLATRLVAHNWSTKALVREIVLSRTYRLGSDRDPAAAAVDPDNVYLWRHAPRRLDAECIHDAMLAAAGTLEAGSPKLSKVAAGGQGYAQAMLRVRPGYRPREDAHTHRAVYLPILRDMLPDGLSLFDFPDPSVVTGERASTAVPAQALYLLNNNEVMAAAGKAAGHVLYEKGDGPRVQAAYRRCLGREPTASEEAAATTFVRGFMKTLPRERRGGSANEREAWAALCQALFCSAEFSQLQ